MWEQLEIAAQYQHYWADNSVSITVTFKPEEAADIKTALEMYETRLKAVSFLRYEETGYVQAPYEPITREDYEQMSKNITEMCTIFKASSSTIISHGCRRSCCSSLQSH